MTIRWTIRRPTAPAAGHSHELRRCRPRRHRRTRPPRFIARSGGQLFVGVNDSDHHNNAGELSFDIHVTSPDAQTWTRGGVQTCE